MILLSMLACMGRMFINNSVESYSRNPGNTPWQKLVISWTRLCFLGVLAGLAAVIGGLFLPPYWELPVVAIGILDVVVYAYFLVRALRYILREFPHLFD